MQFHLYGFIIGIAATVGLWLASIPAKRLGISESEYEKAIWWLVGFGFLGARFWHVLTDYQLYVGEWYRAFFIWQGGLSIIGGVAAALVGLWLFSTYYLRQPTFFGKLIDCAVFGLPVAQAIGRIGNYVNHELYGVPTQLPWGIFIPPEYRLTGYESITHFHPLFAYELLATSLFAVIIWVLYVQHKNFFKVLNLGSGKLATVYLLYYCVVRFGLDFLRIDRGPELWKLGFNQAFLLLTIAILSVVLWKLHKKPSNNG